MKVAGASTSQASKLENKKSYRKDFSTAGKPATLITIFARSQLQFLILKLIEIGPGNEKIALEYYSGALVTKMTGMVAA